MRRICLLLALMYASVSFAQMGTPVSWSFSSRKLSANSYEVRLSAKLDEDWHIYSQSTPDGGPIPTNISFMKNPLVTLSGGVKEVGKMEQHFEPLFGVDVKQFSGKVDFVQNVTVAGNAKTTLLGTVEFMVCNDHECLPPSKQKFTIELK